MSLQLPTGTTAHARRIANGRAFPVLLAILLAAFAIALLAFGAPGAKAFAAGIADADPAGTTGAEIAGGDEGEGDGATAESDANADANAKVLEINDIQQFANAFANGGDYKLMCDINLTEDVIADLSRKSSNKWAVLPTSKRVNIDLNDKTISVARLDGRCCFYVEEGGSLTFGHSYSATPQKGGIVSTGRNERDDAGEDWKNNCSLVCVGRGASFTLAHRVMGFDFKTDSRYSYSAAVITGYGDFEITGGAAILDCTARGGLIVDNYGGSGKMDNCQITGCTSEDGAILRNAANQPFEFGAGASILNCTTTDSEVVSVDGTMTFSGVIEGCSALPGTDEYRARNANILYVSGSGKLYIVGGSVRNNHTTGQAGTIQVGWDYETSMTGYCEMSGGTIAEDNANDRGMGNIGCFYGTFKMTGGTLEGSSKATQGPCINIAEHGSAELAGGTLTGCRDGKPYRGGTVYNKGTLTVSGATLDANGCEAQCGGLVYQTGSTAKTVFTSGTMTGGGAYGDILGNKGYGGGIYVDGGSLEMGGTDEQAVISDCITSDKGGGVFYRGSEAFVMNKNALITDCSAGDSKSPASAMPEGGGVYLERRAFEMNEGAVIENCTANAYGGGVSCNTGSGGLDCENGSAIRGCTSDLFGGAAYSRKGGIFVQEGATVTGNSAKNGGAFAIEGKGTCLSIWSAVSGNTASEHGGGAIVLGAAEAQDAPQVEFWAAGCLSGNTAASDGGSGLYLDYLRSTDPDTATHIAPAATPAGYITVLAQNEMAREVTRVLCEKDALGTDEASESRLLFEDCSSALEAKFTFEDASIGYLALGKNGEDLHIWKRGKPAANAGGAGGATDPEANGGSGGSAYGARTAASTGDGLACLRFLLAPLFGLV